MFPHAMYMCSFGCGRLVCGRRGGLMVSALDSVPSCLASIRRANQVGVYVPYCSLPCTLYESINK